MKTTVEIRDDLLARAKELAARNRTSLPKIIEEPLRFICRERVCGGATRRHSRLRREPAA